MLEYSSPLIFKGWYISTDGLSMSNVKRFCVAKKNIFDQPQVKTTPKSIS